MKEHLNGTILTMAILTVLVSVLMLFPGVSCALTLKQEALVGLKGVKVVIEDIKPKAEHLGLTQDQIMTDLELRLRKARIRVLTEKERLTTPGFPALYVNVNTMFMQEIPTIVYSVRVEVRELVTLARGTEITGSIWGIGYIGCVGTGKIGGIRSSVGDVVDNFINDYLAANPK